MTELRINELRNDPGFSLSDGMTLHLSSPTSGGKSLRLGEVTTIWDDETYNYCETAQAAETSDGRWVLFLAYRPGQARPGPEKYLYVFHTRKELGRFLWENTEGDGACLRLLNHLFMLRFAPTGPPHPGPSSAERNGAEVRREHIPKELAIDRHRHRWKPEEVFRLKPRMDLHLLQQPGGAKVKVRIARIEVEVDPSEWGAGTEVAQIAETECGHWVFFAEDVHALCRRYRVFQFDTIEGVVHWLWSSDVVHDAATAFLLLRRLGAIQLSPRFMPRPQETCGRPGRNRDREGDKNESESPALRRNSPRS